MVTTGICAVLEELNRPLVIRKIEIPDLEFGQVLVKILYSGVCRSQLMEVEGGRGDDKWLPHMLGHEGSGEVISIGPGVTKVKVGDNVILGWIRSEGIDASPPRYFSDMGVINAGKIATFANYSVISENRISLKPENMAFDEAVLYGCALLTGAGMIFNELKPNQGDKLLILGLGGIGLSALIAALSLGIKDIYAIDISESKLEFARKLGVKNTYNVNDVNILNKVISQTAGGVDLCVESAGLTSSIELGFKLLRPKGGRLLFASHPPSGEVIKIDPYALINGKTIAGSWGGSANPDRDIPKFNHNISRRPHALNLLIPKKYSLNEVNEALNDMRSGRVFRPIIQMSH